MRHGTVSLSGLPSRFVCGGATPAVREDGHVQLLGMAFERLESAQALRRVIRGACLVAPVRTGGTFEDGILVERGEAGAP